MDKNKLKSTIKIAIYLLIVCLMVYFLEGWGILGLIIFVFGLALYRMWRVRDYLKMVTRHMETLVWGKTLDKENWGKGEMKNTRLEIVWGKGKKLDYNLVPNLLVYPLVILLFLAVMFDKFYFLYVAGVFLAIILYSKIRVWRSKNEETNAT